MIMRKKEMWVCPKCGDDNTRMEDSEMDFDCLLTKWYCPNCGESWNEYYTLTYDGYYQDGKMYDAEGKECTNI